MLTQTICIEGMLAAETEKRYIHLPFEIPPGAVRLEVTFEYSDRIGSNPLLQGGNTIDLGVFDERGIAFLKAGFRGWSGSERDSFYICESDAAPGYLAGPLKPGQWHLLLGLYKIAPQGCSYRSEITVTTSAEVSITQPVAADYHGRLPASSPQAQFSPWLRGELHCHTRHSDGELSAALLVERALERGLDFLAVSDHNTIASQRELETIRQPGLILIRGVEATTFKGHFNIWGIPNWIDFRVQTPDEMQAVIQAANDLGGLTSCGHPKPYGPDWDFRDITNFHCVEVWNGPWSGLNEMALEYWVSLLRDGQRKPAVGGSDFHRASESGGRDIGTPTNWVYLTEPPNAENLLSAVRKGHVSLSADPNGPFLALRGGDGYLLLGGDAWESSDRERFPFQVSCRGGAGYILQLLNQNEVVYETEVTDHNSVIEGEFPAAGTDYVRAELRDADGRIWALTNPIYFGNG